MSPTIEEIQEVLKIFLDSELQDLRLEIGSVRLAVSKSGAPAPQPFSSPAPGSVVAAAAAVPAAPAAAVAAELYAVAPLPILNFLVSVSNTSSRAFTISLSEATAAAVPPRTRNR